MLFARLGLRSWRPLTHDPLYFSKRNLFSEVSEVPFDSLQPERPISIILAEDVGLYDRSWHSSFAERLPKEYGIQSCRFRMDESLTSFDLGLQELQQDVSSFIDAVFVARGPWMSWMAQFYLESLPFKGLVMVDPIQLDGDDAYGIEQFQRLYKENDLESSQQYRMFLEYTEHWGHWSLKLEPGSVPMMVMHTITNRPELKSCAEYTALRHTVCGGDSDDPVPVYDASLEDLDHERGCLETITSWISQRVL